MFLVSAAPILFTSLAVIACGTAALLGGPAGRWTAFLYLSACAATFGVSYVDWIWATPNYPVFAIDTALLVGLYAVALGSRRYWPLWLTGLHLLTVLAHVSAMLAPGYFFRLYFVLEVIWSLPKMAVLLIGVLIDWRRDRDEQPRHRPPGRGSRAGHARPLSRAVDAGARHDGRQP